MVGRGFFYDAWKNRHKWDYFEVKATECPRISAEFLAEEKESMGEYWFNQEYMCQFMANEMSAFREEDIDRIIGRDIEGWSF